MTPPRRHLESAQRRLDRLNDNQLRHFWEGKERPRHPSGREQRLFAEDLNLVLRDYERILKQLLEERENAVRPAPAAGGGGPLQPPPAEVGDE